MLSVNQNKPSINKIFFLYLVLGLLVAYIAYLPVIEIPFYHHDIYKFSNGGFHTSCESEAGYSFLFDIARPLGAFWDCANFHLANTLQSMSYIRAACAVLIGLGIGMLAFLLYAESIPLWAAFFIAGSIFYLPALQTVMIMGASLVIVSMLLGLLSYYFISRCEFSGMKNSIISLLCLSCGLIALFASLFTYPSVTAIFLLPSFARVLFKPLAAWTETRKNLIRDILVYALSCGIFFIIAHHIQVSRGSAGPAGYHFILNFYFFPRLLVLYHSSLPLWNLDAGSVQAVLLNAIIILACIAGLRNFAYADKWRSLQAVLAVLMLLGLGGAVYLFGPPDVAPFGRVIFISQAMGILILFWGLFKLSEFSSQPRERFIFVAAAVLFLAGAFYANRIVTLSALNDYAELNFISMSIAKRIAIKGPYLKRIHIVSPSVTNSTGLTSHEDIFNNYSTLNAGDMANIVNAALLLLVDRHSFSLTNCIFSRDDEENHFAEEAKCIKGAPEGNIVVTYSQHGKAVYPSRDTLLIDMDAMAPLVQPKLTLSQNMIKNTGHFNL